MHLIKYSLFICVGNEGFKTNIANLKIYDSKMTERPKKKALNFKISIAKTLAIYWIEIKKNLR